MTHASLDELKKKMHSSLDVLTKEFVGLRTNRASTALLEPLMIDAYAGKIPITQVGTLSSPEARLITVQVWDKTLVKVWKKSYVSRKNGFIPTQNVKKIVLTDEYIKKVDHHLAQKEKDILQI